MKSLYIIFHDLKKLIIQNKATFAIVVFGLFMTTFGILFYAGYIYQISSEIKETDSDTIKFNITETISKDKIEEIIQHLVEKQDIKSIAIAKNDPTLLTNTYPVVGEYSHVYKQRIMYGKYFEKESNEPQLILPEYMVGELVGYNESPIGKKAILGEEEFIVEGVISFMVNDYLIVPIKYYLENYEIGFIQCTYENNIKNEEELIDYLQGNKGIKQVEIIKPKSLLFTSDFWFQFGQIMLIFALSIINLFTIICFWISRYRNIYNIYSVCGGSKWKVQKLIVGQASIIIFTSISAGVLLFSLCYSALCEYHLIARGVNEFYLLIIFMILILSLLFAILTSLKANFCNEIYYIKE